jgi:hypothetical protein
MALLSWRRSAFLLAFLFAFAIPTFAQNAFQKLVNPGSLANAHAKYEKDCGSCHKPFSRESQDQLCLACHKDVAADIAGQKGLHGRRPEIQGLVCKSCHPDHKGRDTDIVRFDRETFDHSSTDFALAGAHVTAGCAACHRSGEKYSKAASTCLACHDKDDIHHHNLGSGCAACHDETDWRNVRAFDHSRTRYPLQGAHEKVTCYACHAGERYKGLPLSCSGCHEIQDVHRTTYGDKCENCHGIDTWPRIRFDHAKDARFALNGAHAPLKCAGCHTGNIYKQKIGTTCVACHKAVDVHKGSLGPQCARCHNESSWRKKVEFDHNKTNFPLLGLHAPLKCEACHTSKTYKGAPHECEACHEDKAHRGSLGAKCAACHDATGWKSWRFDHDRQTRYALTGAHVKARCASCHQPAPGSTPRGLPTDCHSCHAKQDIHAGFLGKNCAMCHTTSQF